MRSKTANWFIVKIRYEKTGEDGLQKKVTEIYVVDAVSFGEAETRITEYMAAYINGEFEVQDISRAAFKEIFFSDEETADRWYNAKLEFITIDEKTEKEKRSAVTYLVQAGTFDNALKSVNEVMGGTMIDYVTAKIEETKIMDVYEYVSKDESETNDEDL
ncbi:MAG: DUF4494 domain-containing protein [Elusimicrobiaceae bacterium]|nr:DUF4494 domain-containing protein [Elusimicrobiaceae bacterium]